MNGTLQRRLLIKLKDENQIRRKQLTKVKGNRCIFSEKKCPQVQRDLDEKRCRRDKGKKSKLTSKRRNKWQKYENKINYIIHSG